MLLLSNRARDFARLDPTTGRREFFSEDGGQREQLHSAANGQFSFVEGTFIAFYRQNGGLKLRVGEQEHVIDDLTSSRLDEKRGRLANLLPAQLTDRWFKVRKEFHLIRNGESVVNLVYIPPSDWIIPFDFTPFVEEEDFDFILFIHNVLNDSGRRKRIWTSV